MAGNMPTVATADASADAAACGGAGAESGESVLVQTATGRLENIDRVVRRTTKVLTRPEPGHWLVRVPHTRRIAHVDLSNDWLTISVPLCVRKKAISIERISAMLRQNARLNGCPRIVGDQAPAKRHLVADIPAELLPWDCAAEIDSIIAATFDYLAFALDKSIGKPELDTSAPSTSGHLEEALEQAGWPTLSTDCGGIEIPMEVEGDFAAARVEQYECSTRFHVPVLEHELQSASLDSRRAVTLLLWLTASRVRMVKPARHRHTLSLEISLPPMPANAASLSHGCAALSTALQQLLAEAKMLIADEQLAQIYLSNLGLAEATRNFGLSRRDI